MEIEQIEERRYAPLFDCHREGDRSVDNMMVQIGYVLRIFFAGICGLIVAAGLFCRKMDGRFCRKKPDTDVRRAGRIDVAGVFCRTREGRGQSRSLH